MRIRVIGSGSAGNAYIVSAGGSSILLDAGVPFERIRKAVPMSSLSGALITHRHKDHCRAVSELCFRGVNVYALPDVLQECKVSHSLFAKPVHPMVHEDGTIDRMLTVDSFSVVPFMLEHDVPSVGWWLYSLNTLESLLYFTDTAYVRYRFPSVNYMLAECNYCETALGASVASGRIDPALASRIRKTHMSLSSLLEFFDKNDLSRLKQIHLIHLSDANSNEEEIRTAVMKKTGCEVYVA